MSREVMFATGNATKFDEASRVCRQFDLGLVQAKVDVDEIQHHDPSKITEAKLRQAYEQLTQPVVVNDSSWEIPALGGFPGGYMKDVSAWLSVEDFQLLMSNKDDKRIILHEVVAYYDGVTLKMFTFDREGRFVDTPRGDMLPQFTRLVQMDDSDMTIAETLTARERSVDRTAYRHWYEFAEWYQAEVA